MDLVAVVPGVLFGDLDPNHQFARKAAGVGFAQGKTQNVGGLVVTEITLIELPDTRIVHESEADLGVVNAFPIEDRAGEFSHPAAIYWNDFLRRGDGDADHGDNFSHEY
jgi:hypothetical protein